LCAPGLRRLYCEVVVVVVVVVVDETPEAESADMAVLSEAGAIIVSVDVLVEVDVDVSEGLEQAAAVKQTAATAMAAKILRIVGFPFHQNVKTMTERT